MAGPPPHLSHLLHGVYIRKVVLAKRAKHWLSQFQFLKMHRVLIFDCLPISLVFEWPKVLVPESWTFKSPTGFSCLPLLCDFSYKRFAAVCKQKLSNLHLQEVYKTVWFCVALKVRSNVMNKPRSMQSRFPQCQPTGDDSLWNSWRLPNIPTVQEKWTQWKHNFQKNVFETLIRLLAGKAFI